ncbi:MAG: hypothetical protein JJE51_07500 [Thermoanaerobaculia bacterium]|nr:hypothetical protein [Thermoanaerobaculia bacterium]
MRIQETDRVLKDARIARKQTAQQVQHPGFLDRAWKFVSELPGKVTGMFKH